MGRACDIERELDLVAVFPLDPEVTDPVLYGFADLDLGGEAAGLEDDACQEGVAETEPQPLPQESREMPRLVGIARDPVPQPRFGMAELVRETRVVEVVCPGVLKGAMDQCGHLVRGSHRGSPLAEGAQLRAVVDDDAV